ncbi:MAG: nucleotidyltransferase domain-containing protein [Anaerolineae bacterium]
MSADPKLSPQVKEALVRRLHKRPEIRFAILYGSAAEGRPFRDLDIGLWLDRASVPASSDLDYAFALANELEQVTPCSVDVRVINDAPLAFRHNVSRGIPLVINNREAYFHFLERTWDEFFDFKPVAMQYLKELR